MKYRVLGRTGVRVSQLCAGTLSYGREADEETSAAMFHRCRDVGINFFDTADAYADGRSEEILGQLIADCRDEIVLSSKVGFPAGEDVNARGLSRRHIMRSVEASTTCGEASLPVIGPPAVNASTPSSTTSAGS